MLPVHAQVLPDRIIDSSNTTYGVGIGSFAFAQDGERLALGHTYGATILRLSDEVILAELRQVRTPTPTEAVSFSPDGRRVAVGTSHGPRGGFTYVYDTASGDLLWDARPPGYTGDIFDDIELSDVVFSPRGDRVATAVDGFVLVFGADSGEVVAELWIGHLGRLQFLSNGTHLYFRAGPFGTSIIEIASGEVQQHFEGGRSALSPDGTSMLIVPDDPTENCRVTDAASGVAVAERTNVASPTEGLLWRACGADRYIYRYGSLVTLSELGPQSCRNDLRTIIVAESVSLPVKDVRCSPDNNWLAALKSGAIYFYDISDIPTAVRKGRLYGPE